MNKDEGQISAHEQFNGLADESTTDAAQDTAPFVPHGLPDTYPFDADGALCREYLLERGYCCGLGCRNCPYREDLSPTRLDPVCQRMVK